MVVRRFLSVTTVLFVSVLIAVGSPALTGAWVTDSASGDTNTLVGGTVDLKLSEVGPRSQESTTDETGSDTVTDTWEDTNHATDGSDTVNNTLTLDNTVSTVGVPTTNVTVSYVENDTSDGAGPDKTASTIEVVEFTYNGTDYTTTDLADLDGNGVIDLEDLTNGTNADTLSSLTGIGAGERTNLTVRLSGKSSTLDQLTLSGDGLDVTFAIRVNRSSFVDCDRSSNNTIRYA